MWKIAASSRTPSFTCGVDIGTENLAISFLEITYRDESPRIISYKGTLDRVLRLEENTETDVIAHESTKKRGTQSHEAYANILSAIPEFGQTTCTVIEMQLAYNHSVMSRLDGITFGFLKGRFPTMDISLNAPTIRKKFISERVGDESVHIPRGYPATKQQSMFYVGVKHPSYYAFIQSSEEIGKIDDICDSIVYASIAMLTHVTARLRVV